MGRRRFVNPYLILDDVDISGDQASEWSDVIGYDNVQYLIDWSGDAVGSITVEVSNDQETVFTLDFGSTISIADVADKAHQIIINTVAQKYMRLKFVSSSGSGNLNASFTASVRGA